MGELTRLKWTALAIAAAVGAAGATALGCAGAATAAKEQPEPVQGTPLAAMASRPVVVLPVQYIVFSDSLSWRQDSSFTFVSTAPIPPLRAPFLAALDDSIAASLGDRGLRSWTFARAMIASARRNMGMTADPNVLAAESLRRLVKAGDDPVSEPLASQVRSLVALRDARYVILPAILRFENRGAGARGSLLLYLIDTRTSRITWSGEVSSGVSRKFSWTIARSLAERLADLVVAR
jgi:hypothetical protein